MENLKIIILVISSSVIEQCQLKKQENKLDATTFKKDNNLHNRKHVYTYTQFTQPRTCIYTHFKCGNALAIIYSINNEPS